MTLGRTYVYRYCSGMWSESNEVGWRKTFSMRWLYVNEGCGAPTQLVMVQINLKRRPESW